MSPTYKFVTSDEVVEIFGIGKNLVHIGAQHLGLAIAQQFVEVQGGTTRAEKLPEGGLKMRVIFSNDPHSAPLRSCFQRLFWGESRTKKCFSGVDKVRMSPIFIAWSDFVIISKGQILDNERAGHPNLSYFAVFKAALPVKTY